MASDVAFVSLSDHVSQRVLKGLRSGETSLVCWEKGSSQRVKASISKASWDKRGQLELVISLEGAADFENRTEVLFQFSLVEGQYFGQATAVNLNVIDIKNNDTSRDDTAVTTSVQLTPMKGLFKCERRKNFRLRVFDAPNAYFYAPLKHNADITKNRSWNLFDISVTGCALLISGEDAAHFQQSQKQHHHFEYITIYLDQDEFVVDKMEVVYVNEVERRDLFSEAELKSLVLLSTGEKKALRGFYSKSDRSDAEKIYKVGLKFLEVSEHLDFYLSKKIGHMLRSGDFRKQFEEFLNRV